MLKVTPWPVLNGAGAEVNDVLPGEGTSSMANVTTLIATFRDTPMCKCGRRRRPGTCQAWAGQSKRDGGEGVTGKGSGYKMRPGRRAGQGDHTGHIRSFWIIWALVDGQQGPHGRPLSWGVGGTLFCFQPYHFDVVCAPDWKKTGLCARFHFKLGHLVWK